MISARVALVLLFLAAGVTARPQGRPEVRSDGVRPDPPCGLFRPGADHATTADCLSCHGALAGHGNHPVDVEYGPASSGTLLRAEREVVARGVLLPDRQVRCVTCHAARSRWKARVAIPPGARVAPGVNPRDPSTFLRRLEPRAQEALPAGTAVDPRPLCLACHALH